MKSKWQRPFFSPIPIPKTNLPLLLSNSHSHSLPSRAHHPFSVISISSTKTRPIPILNCTKGVEVEAMKSVRKLLRQQQLSVRAANVSGLKKTFVAGATGSTGRRVVEQLLAKAGLRDLEKAKTSLPSNTPALQIVKADVAEAISSDSEAVICATGFSYGWDLFAPWKVDNFGTVNLVDACRKVGVKRFILVSSILVNGAAMGQILNPAYIFLNIFGLTLIAKLQAESYIRKSGIDHTIIRPGGLRNEPPTGNLVMEPEDTLSGGTISRDLVAEVAIEALVTPEASYKAVEIVSTADAPKQTYKDLFNWFD